MYHHYIFSILYVSSLHIQYHMHHHYIFNIFFCIIICIYMQYIFCIIIIYSIYHMHHHYICSIIIWCIIMNFRYKLGILFDLSAMLCRSAWQLVETQKRIPRWSWNVPSLKDTSNKNNLEHIQIHDIYIYINIGILIMIYYPDAPCMEYLPTFGPFLGHM